MCAEQDVGHGQSQIEVIRRYATTDEMQEKIRRAVRLGLTAWNLEYDGHVQAMTGLRDHWDGGHPLIHRNPPVRVPLS